MDDASWSVRVTGSASTGTVAHARKHSFAVGAPLSFDVEHAAITSMEYLLGAVGAELLGGIQLAARRMRVEIDAVEVVVEAALHNPMIYLHVVGEEGDPGIRAIEARVYISSLDDEARVRAVWADVRATAPIVNTLAKALALELKCEVL